MSEDKTHIQLTREQLSARLDTLETKAIRLDRYANQDTNSMQHLRAMEAERNAAKEVILAQYSALLEKVQGLEGKITYLCEAANLLIDVSDLRSR